MKLPVFQMNVLSAIRAEKGVTLNLLGYISLALQFLAGFITP